eukprot:scaffold11305_cov81-Phaeocystis_antarctica.AAC.1
MRSADPSASTARWAGARPRAGRACGRRGPCGGEAEQHKHAATASVDGAPPRERFRRPQVWRRGGSHGALQLSAAR